MERMEQTILYWAWQRLSNPRHPLYNRLRKVKIYVSGSQIAGEGEVKLLEWVMQQLNANEDGDMVLSLDDGTSIRFVSHADTGLDASEFKDDILEGLLLRR